MRNVFLGLILILCLDFPLRSNPILEWYFNELQVDSSGWFVELKIWMPTSFDNFYLSSKSDTAYFKSGLVFSPEYCIITEDTLLSPLYINPVGDSLLLYNDNHFCLDGIVFGIMPNYQFIPAPKPDQSLCFYGDPTQNEYFWYLDNSPTIGLPNDTANAMGFIEGTVSDTAGLPLVDVEVIYGYYEILNMLFIRSVKTDSLGYYRLHDYAKWSELKFEKNNFITVNHSLQNYPDSTVNMDAIMTPVVGIDVTSMDRLPDEFELMQNYPNPFNPSTIISYHLGRSAKITLKLYNASGQEIQTLEDGPKQAGNYQTNWDGMDSDGQTVASGIYFYQLTVSGKNKLTLTRKMMFLK